MQQHSNLYNTVGGTFRHIVESDKRDKKNIEGYKVGRLFLKEVFNNTADKTLSQYTKALSYHTELSNNYATIVNRVCNLHSEYETATIETICYLVYIFDNYIGFMNEYLIAEGFKAEGLSVVVNDYLDTKYKVDILVGSPKSNTAVAIQCKSYTNKTKNTNNTETIKGLYNFKSNYKADDISCIADLSNIENIELRFLYYDTTLGFTMDNTNILRTYNNDSLVDIRLVESGFFSFDINQTLSTVFRKDIPIIVGIDSLINEVKELLFDTNNTINTDNTNSIVTL